jgi:class 3 adenylate cyclase
MSGPRYAKSGAVHIAYDVMGDGPVDLLFVPDGIIPIELMTEQPLFERFLKRLASFSRLIRFDRRGIGLSDPFTDSTPPTLEQWMDDGRAVMDAAGSARAAVLGAAEGGFLATVLAASHPDRISALVLVNATPGISAPPFSELGTAPAAIAKLALSANERWGTDTSGVELFAPSSAHDERFHEWLARAGRRAASPAVARAVFRVWFYSDIRNVLPAVRVPTLVIHRAGNTYLTPEHGRFLAAQIPHARYVEVPGNDHVPYLGDSDAIIDEVEEFLTGVRHGTEANRVLVTLLFIDIVGSTEQAAALSDRFWRDLLERFRSAVRQDLARFNGREVDTAGDGFLATFDGPARAIRCGLAVVKSAESVGTSVRVGLHTGECELLGAGVAGIAVHIAARVTGEAGPGEVLVSRTVRDLVAGAGIPFVDRGTHSLKGVPGEWELYAVTG